jgi:hypothetical protein
MKKIMDYKGQQHTNGVAAGEGQNAQFFPAAYVVETIVRDDFVGDDLQTPHVWTALYGTLQYGIVHSNAKSSLKWKR